MGRERHHIHIHGFDIDGGLAGALGRIHMEKYFVLATDSAYGGDIIEGTQLIVHMHNRNNSGVFANRICHHLRLDQAIGIWLKIGHFPAFAL